MSYFSTQQAGNVVSIDRRLEEQARRTLEAKRSAMTSQNKCMSCFMNQSLCICKAIPNFFQCNELVNSHIDGIYISIYMHFKEWGRTSNTGKLMKVGLPEQSNISVYGVAEDEATLFRELSEVPSLILYPGTGSEPISNYKDWWKEQPKKRLCVIDSTWSLSQSMARRLPSHIPRVRIDDAVNAPSEFLNRKQSANETKISTIEAVLVALQALDESPTVTEPFRKALHYSVDAVLKQAGKGPAYGNIITPEVSSYSKVTGPYTAAKVSKPTYCLLCNAAGDDIVFKNTGIRKNESTSILEPISGNLISSPSFSTDSREMPSDGNTNEYLLKKYTDLPFYRIWRCPKCAGFFPSPHD